MTATSTAGLADTPRSALISTTVIIGILLFGDTVLAAGWLGLAALAVRLGVSGDVGLVLAGVGAAGGVGLAVLHLGAAIIALNHGRAHPLGRVAAAGSVLRVALVCVAAPVLILAAGEPRDWRYAGFAVFDAAMGLALTVLVRRRIHAVTTAATAAITPLEVGCGRYRCRTGGVPPSRAPCPHRSP